MKKIIIFLFFPILVFGQSPTTKYNPKAIALNNKAVQLTLLAGPLDKKTHQQAVKLLDSATSIAPNYYLAYLNKLKPLLYLKKI